MKVFGPRSLSSFFYFLTKYSFWGIIAFTSLIILFMLLGYISYLCSWDNPLVSLSFEHGFDLQIKPLGGSIKGEKNIPALVPFLVFGTMAFYVAVLGISVRLFKSFMTEKIFKKEVSTHLGYLALTFLITACLTTILIVSSPHHDSDIAFAITLFVVAILLFFIKEIFRQGILIQEEHDLTI